MRANQCGHDVTPVCYKPSVRSIGDYSFLAADSLTVGE